MLCRQEQRQNLSIQLNDLQLLATKSCDRSFLEAAIITELELSASISRARNLAWTRIVIDPLALDLALGVFLCLDRD